MIKLSRLNGESFILNANLIETIEGNPDTVISLTTGHKHVVREPIEEVIEKIIRYNAEIQTVTKVIKREV